MHKNFDEDQSRPAIIRRPEPHSVDLRDMIEYHPSPDSGYPSMAPTMKEQKPSNGITRRLSALVGSRTSSIVDHNNTKALTGLAIPGPWPKAPPVEQIVRQNFGLLPLEQSIAKAPKTEPDVLQQIIKCKGQPYKTGPY